MVVYPRDIRVFRNFGPEAIRRPRTKAQQEAKRGAITRLSNKSRFDAFLHVSNSGEWPFMATVNFGSVAPTDGKEVKRCLDRLLTWLVRRGNSIFWRLEFTISCRPHFHLLLKHAANETSMRVKWVSILGVPATRNLLKLETVRKPESLAGYLSKPDYQAWVPEEFKNVGRFWGYRGLESKLKILLAVNGPEAAAAPIVRAAKKVRERKSGRKVSDDGVTGKKLYKCGGEAMAIHVKQLAAEHGLEIEEPESRQTATKRNRKKKKPAATVLKGR